MKPVTVLTIFHEHLRKHLRITMERAELLIISKHVTQEINTARKLSGVVPEDEDRHFEFRTGTIFMHELEHEKKIISYE